MDTSIATARDDKSMGLFYWNFLIIARGIFLSVLYRVWSRRQESDANAVLLKHWESWGDGNVMRAGFEGAKHGFFQVRVEV